MDRWDLGAKPSPLCAADDHEPCYDCTCRCHYMSGPGLEPVEE